MGEARKLVPRLASRLMKIADAFGVVGILALFFGPLTVLPSALSKGVAVGIVRAAALSFGLPIVLLLAALLVGRFAVWLEGSRS